MPAQFISVALDEGPGPPLRSPYADLSKLYSVVGILVRCCDVTVVQRSSKEVSLSSSVGSGAIKCDLCHAKSLYMCTVLVEIASSSQCIYTGICIYNIHVNTNASICVHAATQSHMHNILVCFLWYAFTCIVCVHHKYLNIVVFFLPIYILYIMSYCEHCLLNHCLPFPISRATHRFPIRLLIKSYV